MSQRLSNGVCVNAVCHKLYRSIIQWSQFTNHFYDIFFPKRHGFEAVAMCFIFPIRHGLFLALVKKKKKRQLGQGASHIHVKNRKKCDDNK